MDPTTRVVHGKPDPTVWCNRRPGARHSYEKWFAEFGSTPKLTDAVKAAIQKEPKLSRAGWSKVAKWQDVMTESKFYNLLTHSGWDRAKKVAKSRDTMFTHYSPPWLALRRRLISGALHGEDHRWTKELSRTEQYAREVKVAIRCLSLCAIHHAIGDFSRLTLRGRPRCRSSRRTRSWWLRRGSFESPPMRTAANEGSRSGT